MSWTEHAIWWHVYPLGFCGAPIHDGASHDGASQEGASHDGTSHDGATDNGHTTPTPRLRRLLGWLDYAVELGASGLLLGPIFASQTHGYDSLDQFQIDPRLGGDEEFDELVQACRSRGLRVMLDGVFSHVGSKHPDLLRALSEGPDSDVAELFDIDWDGDNGPVPRVFEGHGGLARLNHASEQTVDYAIRVMNHWSARGADGWRLDAAYSVDPSFWARVLPAVRAAHPDTWFLGEVIHGDYSAYVAEAGLDSVTQYELWKAIWSGLRDRNFFELDWALQRHNDFLASFTPNTFIGNHDVTRIASILGPSGAVTALAILMTIGGIPSIYAGDEQGFTGVKEERFGGDDAVRRPFPDDPAGLAPQGEPIRRAHQDLIGLRRRHSWLTTATTQALSLENTRYTYRAQAADGQAHLDISIDLDQTPVVTIRDRDGATLWSQPD